MPAGEGVGGGWDRTTQSMAHMAWPEGTRYFIAIRGDTLVNFRVNSFFMRFIYLKGQRLSGINLLYIRMISFARFIAIPLYAFGKSKHVLC